MQIERMIFKIRGKIGRFLQLFNDRKYRYYLRRREIMKVNLIIPSDPAWILNKFANEVATELKKRGIDAAISLHYDPSADINHSFLANTCEIANDKTSFMITHIDTAAKEERILNRTKAGAYGICMSKGTRDQLIAAGVRKDRICYINPAQDGQIRPKKVSLGFMHRVYNDNRKRESMLIDICKLIDNRIFKFIIMGSGWDEIVSEIRKMGFEVEYYPEFEKAKYNELMVNLDYYCYFGFDEGSMGYLDAVAAGIGTIVTPQGYHLESDIEITHPVSTIDEIIDVLHNIQERKLKSYKFIEKWTWEKYTDKHIEIWKYMLKAAPLAELLKNRGFYTDGIFSLMLSDIKDQ